jgi:hypothetical protein
MKGRKISQGPVLREGLREETHKARARSAAIARKLEIKFLIVVLSLLLFTDVLVQCTVHHIQFLVTPCKIAKIYVVKRCRAWGLTKRVYNLVQLSYITTNLFTKTVIPYTLHKITANHFYIFYSRL